MSWITCQFLVRIQVKLNSKLGPSMATLPRNTICFRVHTYSWEYLHLLFFCKAFLVAGDCVWHRNIFFTMFNRVKIPPPRQCNIIFSLVSNEGGHVLLDGEQVGGQGGGVRGEGGPWCTQVQQPVRVWGQLDGPPWERLISIRQYLWLKCSASKVLRFK